MYWRPSTCSTYRWQIIWEWNTTLQYKSSGRQKKPGTQAYLSSRLAWSTRWVPRKPRLQRESLFWKNKTAATKKYFFLTWFMYPHVTYHHIIFYKTVLCDWHFCICYLHKWKKWHPFPEEVLRSNTPSRRHGASMTKKLGIFFFI